MMNGATTEELAGAARTGDVVPGVLAPNAADPGCGTCGQPMVAFGQNPVSRDSQQEYPLFCRICDTWFHTRCAHKPACGRQLTPEAVIVLSRKNKEERGRKARKNDQQASATGSSSGVGSAYLFRDGQSKSFQDHMAQARQQMPVNVLLGLQPSGPAASEQSLTMGVAVTL